MATTKQALGRAKAQGNLALVAKIEEIRRKSADFEATALAFSKEFDTAMEKKFAAEYELAVTEYEFAVKSTTAAASSSTIKKDAAAAKPIAIKAQAPAAAPQSAPANSASAGIKKKYKTKAEGRKRDKIRDQRDTMYSDHWKTYLQSQPVFLAAPEALQKKMKAKFKEGVVAYHTDYKAGRANSKTRKNYFNAAAAAALTLASASTYT